jgi:predicted dehydrogenase
MVGGGEGAFIGEVHRLAMAMAGRFELVAGALSSDGHRAQRSGLALGLAPGRCYTDYREMALRESRRSDGIRLVVIVTPNHLHVPVASAFVEAGIDVVCDKPVAASLTQAQQLAKLAPAERVFVMTYNYSAYPMIRAARELVAAGELGDLRVINVEYAQGWLATDAENEGSKQASWRTDPSQAGEGGCIADIGSHAFHLACFVSGCRAEQVSAELSTFVLGRRLDDDAHVRIRFAGGVKGLLWASQVAVGAGNALHLRIIGDKGALSWKQEAPEELWVFAHEAPPRLLRRGAVPNGAAPRLPVGHPEGYIEAFADLYRDIAQVIDRPNVPQVSGAPNILPNLEDGIEGMRFIDAALRSSRNGGAWTSLGDGA